MHPERRAAITKSDAERMPRGWQPGGDAKAIPARTYAGEAENDGLPQSAHRREVKTARGAAGEVVQVDVGGDAKPFECRFVSTGTCQ
jgi:hypothetical protein